MWFLVLILHILIVVISKGLDYVHIFENKNEVHLSVGSGTLLATLVKKTVLSGFKGLEVCTAIPGTLGGAIIMNAGTKDGEIGEMITYVDTCSPSNRSLYRIQREEIKFGYRCSSFMDSG